MEYENIKPESSSSIGSPSLIPIPNIFALMQNKQKESTFDTNENLNKDENKDDDNDNDNDNENGDYSDIEDEENKGVNDNFDDEYEVEDEGQTDLDDISELDINEVVEKDVISMFDQQLRDKFIEDYHPEHKEINYKDMVALCNVVRDDNGNIIDDLHKTLPILSKFEETKIIGIRINQLENGADPLIEVDGNIIDSVNIAEMELEAGVLPFIICRPLPGGRKEFWKISDLECFKGAY
jgi:DNA-directed RNA polymerase subunit K/omega